MFHFKLFSSLLRVPFQATLRIWEKMTQLETEGGIQLLRTHPPSEERISNMKKWLESDFESLQ